MSISETNSELPFVILAQFRDFNPQAAEITNTAAELQHLCDSSDVIIVGVNSVIAGQVDWLFEVAGEQAETNSILVVLDGQGVIPLTAKVLQQTTSRHIIVATTRQMPLEKRELLAASPYSDVWILPEDETKQPDILFLLSILGKHDFSQVLVEDNELSASFLRLRPNTNQPIANEVRFFAESDFNCK